MKSREIKFRAWDRRERKMSRDFDLRSSIAVNQLYATLQGVPEAFKKPVKLENLDWMEFTGLKDKNKREIYEGDIVRGDVTQEYDDGQTHFENVQIVWHEGAWLAQGIGTSESWPAYDFGYLDNIIGNVYENPELLKP